MNVLAFFAHPDDETILAGGTLALLAQGLHHVHFLCATRGEGGELGDSPLCPPEKLGEVREAEMRCAVQALGGSSLTFLDYIDPRIGPNGELFAYTDDIESLASRVIEYLQRFRIDVLVSHGSNGEYGHPAHLLTHQAVKQAVEWLGKESPFLYTASAFFPEHPKPRIANSNDPADLIVDISSVFERKAAAALCHRTQHALFVRRPSKEAGRLLSVPEVLTRLESFHRVHPQRLNSVSDPFMEYLRPWARVEDSDKTSPRFT